MAKNPYVSLICARTAFNGRREYMSTMTERCCSHCWAVGGVTMMDGRAAPCSANSLGHRRRNTIRREQCVQTREALGHGAVNVGKQRRRRANYGCRHGGFMKLVAQNMCISGLVKVWMELPRLSCMSDSRAVQSRQVACPEGHKIHPTFAN